MTPILYTDRLDEFRVGGSRIVRGGHPDDEVAVIAAGITVHEAVAAGEIVRFVHLAVNEMPGSGKPEELLDAAKISVQHIAGALRELARTLPRARDAANV